MKKILSYIIIIGLFLIAGMKSIAIDSRYKNNLLNVELSQTPDNRVSVLLVFEKPYTEPVKVVYKTDNEYNILLPETYHSITSVSTLNALNIRNANVKLIPYFNQDNSNGYTKITLQTTRPVVFNAHASYITTQLAQNDLIDKIEQDEEFKITPTTISLGVKPTKKANKPQVKTNTNKTASKPTAKTPISASKPQVVKTTKTEIKQQTPKTITQTQKQNTKPAEKIATNIDETSSIKPQMPVINESNTELNISEQNATTVQEKIKQPSFNKTTNIATSKSTKTNILSNNINTNNKPISLLIGALVLLILLLARLSHKKEKTSNIPNLKHTKFDYEPNVEDIPQEIKDMSWQEKYKFMKNKENGNISTLQNSNTEENLDDKQTETFPQEIEVINTKQPDYLEEQGTNTESINDLEEENKTETTQKTDPFGFNNPPINEGFEPAYTEEPELNELNDLENLSDLSDIEPTIDVMYKHAPNKEDIQPLLIQERKNETKHHSSNPIEPTLINQAKISKSKGFYLVKYNNEIALMGYINEQIFLLHTFKNQSQSYVQTRLTEKEKGAEIYLVRSENYKSLIKVTNDSMKTLMKL